MEIRSLVPTVLIFSFFVPERRGVTMTRYPSGLFSIIQRSFKIHPDSRRQSASPLVPVIVVHGSDFAQATLVKSLPPCEHTFHELLGLELLNTPAPAFWVEFPTSGFSPTQEAATSFLFQRAYLSNPAGLLARWDRSHQCVTR
jgi:hypothetical protein